MFSGLGTNKYQIGTQGYQRIAGTVKYHPELMTDSAPFPTAAAASPHRLRLIEALAATLAEDLEADSLDAVELNMAIEEACGVTIPDEKLAELKTVQDIFDYINANA